MAATDRESRSGLLSGLVEAADPGGRARPDVESLLAAAAQDPVQRPAFLRALLDSSVLVLGEVLEGVSHWLPTHAPQAVADAVLHRIGSAA